jgi:hypothetical protein
MNDLTLHKVTDMASALDLKEYYAFMSWLNLIIVSIDTIIILWRPPQKVCIGTSRLVGVIHAFLSLLSRKRSLQHSGTLGAFYMSSRSSFRILA